jgi:hypothetical protein
LIVSPGVSVRISPSVNCVTGLDAPSMSAKLKSAMSAT